MGQGVAVSSGARNLVVGASAVAAIVFIGVAITEISYAGAHPFAYGPAKVIAWGAGAGALLSAAVALLAINLGPEDR